MKIKNLLIIVILIFLLLFTYNINNREGFYVGGGGGGDTMQNMIAHRYNELLKKEKKLKECREELQTYKDSEEDNGL